jgi:hypothetical protein
MCAKFDGKLERSAVEEACWRDNRDMGYNLIISGVFLQPEATWKGQLTFRSAAAERLDGNGLLLA